MRGWLRRARANSDAVRCDATVATCQLDPLAGRFDPTGSAVGDTLDAVGRAVTAWVLRFGPVPAPWQVAVALTGAAILAPVLKARSGTAQADPSGLLRRAPAPLEVTDDEHQYAVLIPIERDAVLSIERGGQHTGNAVLPADYVAEHVQLGYAATEHGNQSDTVDIGIELVTAATGRRGLYVGATRGRDTNQLLVVTNDHDPDTARDLLHTVLANDRADTPATAQHRNLADRSDRRPNRPTPRCQIPASFHQLQRQVQHDLAAARVAANAGRQRITDLEHDLTDAQHQLAAAERNLARHRPDLDAADRDVAAARDQQLDAYSRLRHSGRLGARRARRDVAAANHAHENAIARRRDTQAVAQPAQDAAQPGTGKPRAASRPP